MALIEGQPPKAASPKEVGHQAAKAGGWGRLSREGRCSGQRKEVGDVPGLGEDENLQDLDSLLEGLQPPCPPGLESSFHPREDTVPRELDSVGEDWRDGETKDFHRGGGQDPLERPVLAAGPGAEADDGGLAISVEKSSRGSLEVSAGQVHPYDVLEVVPEDLDIVHVPKGGLSDVGHPEAGQDSLQPDQEGLQVNDEEQGGQGVPLADGEEDGEDRGDLMEKKGGCSLSVEGGNPVLSKA